MTEAQTRNNYRPWDSKAETKAKNFHKILHSFFWFCCCSKRGREWPQIDINFWLFIEPRLIYRYMNLWKNLPKSSFLFYLCNLFKSETVRGSASVLQPQKETWVFRLICLWTRWRRPQGHTAQSEQPKKKNLRRKSQLGFYDEFARGKRRHE